MKNTSEGLNIATRTLPIKCGENVLINDLEHPNNAYAFLRLEEEGINCHIVQSSQGEIEVEQLMKAVDSKTRAISISHINFWPGSRPNICLLAEECHRRGIFLMLDAAQSIGLAKIDVKQLGVDILSAGTYKGLMVPHGIAVMYCRKSLVEQLLPTYSSRTGMIENIRKHHDLPSFPV